MKNKNILNVVDILYDSSQYEFNYNSNKSELVFTDEENNFNQIWGDEWAVLLSKYVTKMDNDMLFEIWQPYLRTERIYSAEISERVYLKLFPAYLKKNLFENYYHSDKLLQEISMRNKTIFQIGLPGSFYYKVLNSIKEGNKIVGTIAGEIQIPLQTAFKLRKNQFKTISHIINHIRYKKNINKYNFINYQSTKNLNVLKKLYNGNLFKITMGIDTSIFKKLDKSLCRKELNMNYDKKIILSVGRLDPAKQNHKLINILSKLSDKYEFIAIFIGCGDREYENYLNKISEKLIYKNQILFTGYLKNELLAKYYNCADVFFMSSASEGGPVVCMEALACGTPVISTDTGNVAEFIMEQAKNNIVGKYNYSEWESVLEKFLKGDNVDTINIDLVKEKYSWDSVARKFIEIYRECWTDNY